MLNRNRVIGFVLIAVLLLAAAPAVLGAFSPEVFVIDQPVIDNTVNITRATIEEAGWVVVHADEDGAPGPVLGQTALPAGINANVKVELDPAGITDVLHAMLHVDAGEADVFDLDGADGAVERNGEAVVKSFAVSGQESTVVKLLAEDERVSTLVSAIEAAGLTEALREEQGITLFAPSNEAFAALDTDALDALLADPEQLSQVLLYHVAPGVLLAADVADGEVETLQGAPLTLAAADGVVTVNDVAVTEADISGYNGVIHLIDSVLLPPAPEEATEEAVAEETVSATIGEVIAGNETLSTLTEAIAAAGLEDTLAAEGPFTLFAPSNEAFAALPAAVLDGLLADPTALKDVLLYHVVPGALSAEQLPAEGIATSAQGSLLVFAIQGDGASVNSKPISQADIAAGNGIIHVIDSVLLPPQKSGDSAVTGDATEEATEEATSDATEEATVAAAAATVEPTAVPTVAPTATDAPTATAEPTDTPQPTATDTPAPTATATPEPTDTPEPTSTATLKPTNTPQPTATDTPEPTNTPAPTATNTPEPTSTATLKPTNTPQPTATNTPQPTNTPAPTATAVPTEAPTEAPTAVPTEAPVEAPTEATIEAGSAVTTETGSEAVAVITLEVTPEATEEATAEATEEATEEATAEATEEATAEATAEPTEEVTAEATEAAVEEAIATETPAEMPTSGGELSGGSLTLAVVAGVLAALMGGAFVTRRRGI